MSACMCRSSVRAGQQIDVCSLCLFVSLWIKRRRERGGDASGHWLLEDIITLRGGQNLNLEDRGTSHVTFHSREKERCHSDINVVHADAVVLEHLGVKSSFYAVQ